MLIPQCLFAEWSATWLQLCDCNSQTTQTLHCFFWLQPPSSNPVKIWCTNTLYYPNTTSTLPYYRTSCCVSAPQCMRLLILIWLWLTVKPCLGDKCNHLDLSFSFFTLLSLLATLCLWKFNEFCRLQWPTMNGCFLLPRVVLDKSLHKTWCEVTNDSCSLYEA